MNAPARTMADIAAAGAPHKPRIVAREEWVLVGARSGDSLLVRGGEHPIAIRVSHPDSGDLIDLLSDANIGAAIRSAVP